LQSLHARLDEHRDAWTEHHVAIRTLPAAVETPRAPKRVALFIGLGEYADPQVCKPYPELGNSAVAMHELLLRVGGLDPASTRLLRDKQAGKAEIRQAITEWLPSVSQPGDDVFLYYSGRSCRYATADLGETDGFDEAVLPYDTSIGAAGASLEQKINAMRQTSIVDDELAYWLQSLNGRRVVLILDTNFAGGVVEGKSLAGWFDGESRRVKDISQMNVVVITSCSSDEQIPFEGGPNKLMWFTHCLAHAIESRPPGKPLTVVAAFRAAASRMRELLPQGSPARLQEPMLVDRALLPVELVP
jgi:hypothetical protein